MILGVASPWAERKGLSDFMELAGELDSDKYVIVLIGLDRKQRKRMTRQIVALSRTNSVEALVKAYRIAEVFFNPICKGSYPILNLEAEACETPVLTFDTGERGETITLS